MKVLALISEIQYFVKSLVASCVGATSKSFAILQQGNIYTATHCTQFSLWKISNPSKTFIEVASPSLDLERIMFEHLSFRATRSIQRARNC